MPNQHERLFKLPLIVALVVLLQSCALEMPVQLPLQLPMNQVRSLPAAAYFQWAETATAEERVAEAERLVARTGDGENPVTLVQRAILEYHDDGESNPLAAVGADQSLRAACNNNTRCLDYATFGDLIRELWSLERELGQQRESAGALRDQIRVLNQQIEALTNIEQRLLEREQRSQ